MLRPLYSDDWEALLTVASDPLIWEMHPAHDRWREKVFQAFFADALANRGAVVAIEKSTGKIIGSSRWQNHDAARSSVEIGWTFLARSHWGGAWNLELKRLMVGHALQWVTMVEFCVGEDNFRSRRALEKIGAAFSPRAEMRDMAGGPRRHLFYEISRENFANGPLSLTP